MACVEFRIRISLVALALAMLLVGGAEAATLTVDDSGGANYNRIQDAINNAKNGDTILVYSGIYYENVDANKQLILKGIDTGGGKPVVDARGSGNVITLSIDGITLEGFKIVNAGVIWSDAGIRVKSNNNIVRNNIVDSNTNNGIDMSNSNNNLLSGNIASNNRAGISLADSNSNMVSGNNVFYNYNGINLFNSINNTLKNNTASENDYGISLSYSNNNILIGNTASNNGAGIQLQSSSNNYIYNNLFNNRDNFVLTDSSNRWNTTKTPLMNIVGGAYIGGNFWVSPDDTGFGQICVDGDNDGICDSPFVLDSSNIDYLPFAYKPVIPKPMDWTLIISIFYMIATIGIILWLVSQTLSRKGATEREVQYSREKRVYLTVALTILAIVSILPFSNKIIILSLVTIFVGITINIKKFYPYSVVFAIALIFIVYAFGLDYAMSFSIKSPYAITSPAMRTFGMLIQPLAYWAVIPLIITAALWRHEKLGVVYPIALSIILGIVVPSFSYGEALLPIVLITVGLIFLSGAATFLLFIRKFTFKSVNKYFVLSIKVTLSMVTFFITTNLFLVQ